MALNLRSFIVEGKEWAEQYEKPQVDRVEREVIEVAMVMILKLNETIFRPIFSTFVDSLTQRSAEGGQKVKIAKSTTLYIFLEVFFGRLKVSGSCQAQMNQLLTKPVNCNTIC